MEVSRPGGRGDQVLLAGQRQQKWEFMSQQRTAQIWFFLFFFLSVERQQCTEIKLGRRNTRDFPAKWWQLMLLFISLRQTSLLPQLTQCEHTHVVWWGPYPSKWTHTPTHTHTGSASPCLCLPLPLENGSQIQTIDYDCCAYEAHTSEASCRTAETKTDSLACSSCISSECWESWPDFQKRVLLKKDPRLWETAWDCSNSFFFQAFHFTFPASLTAPPVPGYILNC